MPSTQLNQNYSLLANPSFLAQIVFQDEVGDCFYPTTVDVAEIRVTHYFKSNQFPRPDYMPVPGMENIPVSAFSVLPALVTGADRNAAFQYTGVTPFDYNFVAITPVDANWFPETGSYKTEFTVILRNGSQETIVFLSNVTNLSYVLDNLTQPFRIVERSYTKRAGQDGKMTVDWTKPTDVTSITIDVLSESLQVLQTVNVPTDAIKDTLVSGTDCMFLDGTPKFDWNFEYLWKDFTHITRRNATYYLRICFNYSESSSIWDAPPQITVIQLVT